MELIELTWRVCEGVTLTRWMLSPERESWTVRWTTTGDDRRQRSGVSAAEVLRVAADEAPGRYRDALLAAAADPPSGPARSESSPQPERPAGQAPREEWIAAALLSGWEAGRDMRHEGMAEDVLADQWQATESGAALTEGARWSFIRGVRAARRRATFSATISTKD